MNFGHLGRGAERRVVKHGHVLVDATKDAPSVVGPSDRNTLPGWRRHKRMGLIAS